MSNQSIEHKHQVQFIRWAKHQRVDLEKSPFHLPFAEKLETLFDYLYAVPNGGKRPQKQKMVRGKQVNYSPEAAKLKAEGVKAGVLDICITAPVAPHHGLYMELKRPEGRDTSAPSIPKTQKEFGEKMMRAGYQVAYCWGFDELVEAVTAYFQGDTATMSKYSIPKYKR